MSSFTKNLRLPACQRERFSALSMHFFSEKRHEKGGCQDGITGVVFFRMQHTVRDIQVLLNMLANWLTDFIE